MKIKITGHQAIVTREPDDPKYYGIKNGAGESRFLYALKKQLNEQGYDLIKKRMHKDGHLVDEKQQYLRARKRTKNPSKDIMIWNTFWAIRGAEEDFNEGKVVLGLGTDVFIP